jgi:Na+/proline symporter
MKTYRHYITGSLVLGVSTGMISLLARWITGNAILSSPESLVKFGLLGGIGYSLVGAMSIFSFGIMATKIRKRFPDYETLGDLFQHRLKRDGYWIMTIIVLFLGLDSLFMQAVGAAVLFDLLLDIPFSVSLFFFFLYCFVIAGLGGMKWIQRFEGISVFFIFAAIIFIPLYFFIQEGAFAVYDGIRLYHPYLLFTKNQEGYFFIFTFMLVAFGQILTDRATWQRLYMIELKKLRMTFWATAFVWGTIPIALSAMLMIVIFEGTFGETYSLLFQLITKIDPLFLAILFFLFCFGTLSTTIHAELHATTVHFIKHIRTPFKKGMSDRKMRQESYVFSAILLLFLLIVTHFVQFSLLDFLFFYGHLYAAAIPVMLTIVLSKRVISRLLPYSIIIGWLLSVTLFSDFTSLQTTWISFAISLSVSVLSMLFAEVELYDRKNK